MVSEYSSCAMPMYKHYILLIVTGITELPTLTLVTSHRFRQIDVQMETVQIGQKKTRYNEDIN